jgi:hypothetical protein
MRPLPRAAQLATAALAGALLAGGGYALAAGNSNTIHGCLDSHNVLHVQRTCKRGQRAIVWNRQGPQGPQGPQGAPGPPDASAWAVIGTSGVGADVISGSNITVTRDGVGVYTVAAGGPCSSKNGAITVTPENGPIVNPDHIPETVVVRDTNSLGTLVNRFDIHLYADAAGTLGPEDGATFDVIVSCQ